MVFGKAEKLFAANNAKGAKKNLKVFVGWALPDLRCYKLLIVFFAFFTSFAAKMFLFVCQLMTASDILAETGFEHNIDKS